MKLVRYNPIENSPWSGFNRLAGIDRTFDQLFDSAFGGSELAAWSGDWSPAIDVHQSDEAVTVTAELPGMKREEIELTLEDGALIISGERKLEKEHDESRTFRSERYHGQFKRYIQLPAEVDGNAVTAAYQDGVLKVELPLAAEAKPKKITVNVD